MKINEFFLLKSDVDNVTKNIPKKKALLIGSYGGYGKNFGDIIQAKGIIKFYNEKGFLSFILLHLNAIKEVENIWEYKNLFPEAIPIFWGNYNQEIHYPELVNKLDLNLDILHLYGGGFLNEFWGKVVIESVEESFQRFNIKKYYISGQQISEKVVPYLQKHIEYYQPSIIGTRDYDSINFLNKHDIKGIFSGDDSLEVLEEYSALLKPNIKSGDDVCFFHLNISDYAQEEFERTKKEIKNLILSLESLGIRKFIFFHSYTRNSVIVKDTLKALDYLGISDILPSFNVISLPALLLSEDERNRVFKELGDMGKVKYAFSNSYHTAFLFALSGIPTYLFAFNQYYRQKQRGLFGQQITLSEFLSNTNEIYKAQQEYIRDICERRKNFLKLLNENLEGDNLNVPKHVTEVTYTLFPSKSRELFEIDSVISYFYSENQGLKKEIEAISAENQGLKKEIEAISAENQGLKKEIENIKSGDFYKVALKYYHLREKILPYRSLRRAFVRFLWNLIKKDGNPYQVLFQESQLFYYKIKNAPILKNLFYWNKFIALKDFLKKKYVTKPDLIQKETFEELYPLDKSLVSVIIPCYNYGKFLYKAIESVKGQTLKDIEIIIVNDGSTDIATLDILKNIEKKNIARVIHQKNKGLPSARNTGISYAKGKYICCLDADDYLESTYLEKATAILESNLGISFVYPFARLFGAESGIWYTEDFNFEKILFQNHVAVCAVFRRKCWEVVGGYDENMKRGYEDWEFWIRLGKNGFRGRVIPEPLFNYRKHPSSMYNRSKEIHNELFDYIKKKNHDIYNNKEIGKIKNSYSDVINKNFFSRLKVKQFEDDVPKVIIATPNFVVGGAESIALDLGKLLKNDFGYQTIFVSTSLLRGEENNAFNMFTEISPFTYTLSNYFDNENCKSESLKYIFEKNHPILLISNQDVFSISVFKKIEKKFPSIVIVHNIDEKLSYILKLIEMEKYIDYFVVVSEKLYKEFLDRYHNVVNPSKVTFINNGVDANSVFNPGNYNKENLRLTYGVLLENFICCYIGRFSYDKQIEHLLEVVVGQPDNVKLILCGKGENLKYDQYIRETILKNKKLKDRVIIFENLPNNKVAELLAISDVFLLTSMTEGMPLSVMEAMAMKLPVCCYSVGGLPYLIKNGEDGFLIEPNNIMKLIEVISFLRDNPFERQRIGENARNLILQNFDKSIMLEKYKVFFQQIVSQNSAF